MHLKSLYSEFQVGMIFRWQELDKIYFSNEYCAVISDARASEIQKYKDLPYFVKTILFLQRSY